MKSEHEEQELTLTLPWPPSVNEYWKPNGRGGVRVAAAGKQYQADVAALLTGARVRGFGGKARLSVDVALYPPDRRQRDVDNTWKALLDSMEKRKGFAGIYDNDAQIDATSNLRCAPEKPGRVVVRVAVMTSRRHERGFTLVQGWNL